MSNNSKLFTGSICVTELLNQMKNLHSSFTKSQNNGKIYCNILLWENDEPDEYKNTHSIQLNSTKEKKETEPRIYIGNAKPIERKEPQPIKPSDLANMEVPDDLPF